jgi:hypothetical protein
MLARLAVEALERVEAGVSIEPLTDKNWLLLAMRAYDNPGCHETAEFFEDMKRIKYIKKLVTQYQRGGELKERLILNHIIALGNVLGPYALVRILFLKMREHLEVIKPFLVLLNVLPDVVPAIGRDHRNYYTDDITMDGTVVVALRKSVP